MKKQKATYPKMKPTKMWAGVSKKTGRIELGPTFEKSLAKEWIRGDERLARVLVTEIEK